MAKEKTESFETWAMDYIPERASNLGLRGTQQG